MINKDFYPTPNSLINKMLEGVSVAGISILEPSAGKGDICDVIKERTRYGSRTDIDTIEIEEDLRMILKGKEYRVVHDDFLTFDTKKKYDLVIANFPFSDGDLHLRKALEIIEQRGGGIICLVNSETIKNPYTNIRKEILAKLDKYGATIEYLANEFVDAERKTNVEVALVRVYTEVPKTVSVLLDNLRKARSVSFDEQQHNEIVEVDFIKALISRFNVECELGIKLINEYENLKPYMLDRFYKNEDEKKYAKSTIEMKIGDGYGDSVNNYLREVREKYWSVLINDSRFKSGYTSNILKKLEEKLVELIDYDFTEFNIKSLQDELNKSISLGIEDAILKLFDTFSCQFSYNEDFGSNIHYYNGWKSNKAHKINKKVIIPLNGFGSYGSKDRLEYCAQEKLKDMVKVFNYLANEIEDVLALSGDSIKRANEFSDFRDVDFVYFKTTFYKKGTCHITFKNDKLLEKFNIYGSQRKGWLPPSYGEKSYSEMDSEERSIVDDFQGKKNYEEVLKEKDYYLVESKSLLLK